MRNNKSLIKEFGFCSTRATLKVKSLKSEGLRLFLQFGMLFYFDSVNRIAANLSGIEMKGVWLLGNEYSLLI